MDKLIYVAMTGAKQVMRAQAAVSHNLANANTTGFRADQHAFSSLPISGPGFASRVNAVASTSGWDSTPGARQATGRELDVAVQGQGWLAVQTPDGGEAYTRAGDLRVGAGGILANGAGYPVLGDGGPVAVPPFEKLVVGSDGTISVVPLGQSISTLAVVDRLKLVDPPAEDLIKREDGLLRLRDGEAAPAAAGVRIASGELESSNVNAADAMVSMIRIARQWEMQVKVMKTAEENSAAAARLVQTN